MHPSTGNRVNRKLMPRLYCVANGDDAVHAPPLHARPDPAQQVEILERRMKRLENVLRDVCGAILYCDDIAVLERNAAQYSSIYRDMTFAEKRDPLFMRREIQKVLSKHQMIATPVHYNWIHNYTK